MHEFILSQPDFVHVGRDVTNLALRSYLIEIHWENTRELLHLFIIWGDVRVQNLGDFALEKISVAQENSTKFQVHYQR